MTHYQLLSYNEVLVRTENTRRYLLLGNGFSIAYDKIFSFKNLFDHAVNKIQIIIVDHFYSKENWYQKYLVEPQWEKERNLGLIK